MRIAVVGAGAMGSLFAGLMALAGDDVWLVGYRQTDHVEAMKARGLGMTYGDDRRVARPRVTFDAREPGVMDALIFLTKTYSTDAAARGAKPMIGPETLLVSLQNGVGNAEAIMAAVGPARVVAGVTNIGATVTSPGEIKLTEGAYRGTGDTWMSGYANSAPAEQVEALAAQMRRATIQTHVSPDVDQVIWRKLALVAGMSSVTAVTRLRIGSVLEAEEGRTLLRDIIMEVAKIAAAKGIALDSATIVERCFATYNLSRGHITSMAADIVAGLPTEIGAFNEAVVREAEKIGMDAPVNRAMARLVRLVEGNYGRILPTKYEIA
jgi:2-dehydropantoate 2-reductase